MHLTWTPRNKYSLVLNRYLHVYILHITVDFTQVSSAVFGPSSAPTFSVSSGSNGLVFTPQSSCGQEGNAGLFCLGKNSIQEVSMSITMTFNGSDISSNWSGTAV